MYIRMELRGDDDLSVCLSSRSDAISILLLLRFASVSFHFIFSSHLSSAQLCRFPFAFFSSAFLFVLLFLCSIVEFVCFSLRSFHRRSRCVQSPSNINPSNRWQICLLSLASTRFALAVANEFRHRWNAFQWKCSSFGEICPVVITIGVRQRGVNAAALSNIIHFNAIFEVKFFTTFAQIKAALVCRWIWSLNENKCSQMRS